MAAHRAAPVTERLVIAHVVAPAPVGGLERVVRGLAAGHAARGHSVHVINLFDRGDAITPVDMGGFTGPVTHVIETPRRRYWSERAAVRDLCRSVGARIVHTHGYRPDVVAAGVAPSVGARRVTTVHGFTGGSLKARVFERLQVRAFRSFDAVVAVSRTMASFLQQRGVGAERLHCVPNAWSGSPLSPLPRAEARRQLGLPPDATCVGWVGRLSREKGADVLLEALALVAENPIAAFVGDGRELGALRSHAATIGIEKRVMWCGSVPEVSRCYAAFDLFVMSSRTEGTPIVLFEAMTAGIPLVVTSVGGIPDVVGGTEALLVPPEDPRALAAAIDAALADRGAAAARAAAASRRLESGFSAGPWLDRYEAVYNAALGGAR